LANKLGASRNSDVEVESVMTAKDIASILPKACIEGATLWIGGEWQHASSKQRLSTENPATGQTIIEFARGGRDDVDRAVSAASGAAQTWWKLGGTARAAILRKAAALTREHGKSLGMLDTLDSGRVIAQTAGSNVETVAGYFEFYAGMTDKIRGFTIDMGGDTTCLAEREPIGVVGAISPWNYPMLNAAMKIAPILACGNALVLKPAEQAPLSTLLIAQILDLAGLPKGVFNVITGLGTEAGAALVDHPDVPKISFTGSTATGRHVAASAGKLLKSVTLELGGKSPLIVFDDADVEAAASAAVQTVFMNLGQTCTSCARVFVARSRVEEFVDHCRRKVEGIRIGDPADADISLGPIISRPQMERVQRLLADGKAAGAKAIRLATGNYKPVAGGYYIEPAILTYVPEGSELWKQEIFGPVMLIDAFDADEEAYARANDTEYGLASSVWTTSLARAEVARRRLDTGLVWINCVHSRAFNTPVPPHKASGIGSEFGTEVFDNYMKMKSTVTMFGAFRGMYG
jgi:acyl-CoA reductase-like NAD-dependent aldehyde dehydrogenase